MAQRGRKSAAKLQTVAVQMTRKPPKAPIELTEGAAKIAELRGGEPIKAK